MGYGSSAWADLIAQIRRDPKSDELRNVAADYLIENDDPRGEFIVLRNRLAAGNIPSSEYVAVYDRHRELEREQPWKEQLAKFPMTSPPPFTGFVEVAHVARDGFERLGEICRCEPVTRLVCSGLDPLTPDLLDMPELDDMRSIDVDGSSASLYASPRLGGVRVVKAATLHRGQQTYFQALGASMMRPHRLVLDSSNVNHLSMLARTPVLDELRELPLASDEGLAALGDHALSKLDRLDTTRLSRASVERLASTLDQLAALKIGYNADLILPIVIANVHSGNLRDLSLVIRADDVPTVIELIDSAACLQLEKLSIRGLPLPLAIEQTIRKLAFHGHLREVRAESRRGERIQIPGVHVIEAS